MTRAVRCGLAIAAPLMLAAGSPAAACTTLDWTMVAADPARRPLIAEDLVRLRDVGPLGDDQPAHHALALSPDGRHVAFQLRQADPSTNGYCLALVVLATAGDRPPVFADRGGELIRGSVDAGVEPVRRTGVPAIITPHWSADGRFLLHLRQDAGIVQLWRSDAEGRGSLPLTRFADGVLDVRLDGGRAILKLPGDRTAARAALAQEAAVGFHLDGRVMPLDATAPAVRVEPDTRFVTLDLATGAMALATAEDAKHFDGAEDVSPRPAADICQAITRPEGAGVPVATRIVLACPGAPLRPCLAPECTGSSGPLWTGDGGRVVRFARREGWARSTTAVYEWDPAASRLQRLYATDALLIDCRPHRETALICLRELSLAPRHLVRIDLADGKVTTLADFNPEFQHIALGVSERLPLRSSVGLEAFADLVRPVGYVAGRRYPLIVVQYQSRGFLRGGTGDEFPIQLFANNGFAVLSIQRPPPAAVTARPADYVEMDRIGLQDFADRRNVLSVVEAAVDRIVARGTADPRAIGITGLSDGSSTVQFAALNSRIFSAAIVSGCCWEPGQTALLGPAAASIYARIGWPGVAERADAFWSRLSIVRNADRVAMPMLFEMADEEFRAALPSFTALRERERPADFFIFPDEHHIKWQPAHRLAAYLRGLDWFNYWLRGLLPADPRRRSEASRWVEMDRDAACRAERGRSAAAPVSRPCLGVEKQ
ncbi:dipeptidyl aminopeptidase/acylaminoacyl peptidase [Sphingomonas zeicaulis]|uniref:Atxe2 family lasso peptide isopeptidase n=1 Tax=Sphingomonas zeicaulis TaxID=1632740 RepID=UPI003D219CE2